MWPSLSYPQLLPWCDRVSTSNDGHGLHWDPMHWRDHVSNMIVLWWKMLWCVLNLLGCIRSVISPAIRHLTYQNIRMYIVMYMCLLNLDYVLDKCDAVDIVWISMCIRVLDPNICFMAWVTKELFKVDPYHLNVCVMQFHCISCMLHVLAVVIFILSCWCVRVCVCIPRRHYWICWTYHKVCLASNSALGACNALLRPTVCLIAVCV